MGLHRILPLRTEVPLHRTSPTIFVAPSLVNTGEGVSLRGHHCGQRKSAHKERFEGAGPGGRNGPVEFIQRALVCLVPPCRKFFATACLCSVPD
jgi:hypothetical protein